MKFFLVVILFFENFLLFCFRPWGPEKSGWTLFTGLIALITVLLMVLLSLEEDKEKEKQNKAGF